MLLELLLSTVAVDNQHLELGGRRVLVCLLDEVSERLHEAFAWWAVLSSKEDSNMCDLSAHESILHSDLLIRIEGLLWIWHVGIRLSSFFVFLFFLCRCRLLKHFTLD